MSKLNIDDITNRCRYIQIDLPFRGVEDELYNYRRPFEELLEDEEEDFPLANYETQRWVAVLDIQKKSIIGWNSSYGSVRIDAKVRDEGIYTLLDSEMQTICRLEGYVPNGAIPPKDGCGDYIRFEIDDKGRVSSLYEELDFTEFADKGILPDYEVIDMRNINEVNSILIYSTPDGQNKIEVNLNNDTVWLNLDQIAELFQRNKSTISRHIRNIFEEGELSQNSVVAKNATTATDGKTYQVDYYNLDMIISVGYRVNSLRGTHFRMWATQVLREYIVKGFAMDDERLKRGGGGNYFDELLSRIRDIRSSEKLFYRKVLEIYALSIDYDPRSEVTKQFFASVQNKMHYATHGKTAAELIYTRADAEKDFMGLTSWTGSLPQKSDAEVAKNYLSQPEIDVLNRIVTLYLDFAELQAMDKRPMYMKDWLSKLDDFLKLSGKELLNHAGTISAETAKMKAHSEHERFRERIQYELSPVEIHFIESFEQTRKKLKK